MIARNFLLFTLIVVISGCSLFKRSNEGVELNEDGQPKFYSQSLETAKRIEKRLSRDEVVRLLSVADATNRIRLVELFGTSAHTPRYKVMKFDPKGIYHYLGLMVGDYILAADNYIIYNRELFPKFISLLPHLPKDREATIHILRGGSEILLVYSID